MSNGQVWFLLISVVAIIALTLVAFIVTAGCDNCDRW